MLTAKQRELLLFIDSRLKESGISPSFDEMREALDLKSKSGVHRLISALEERGFIRRLPNRARALEVVKLPETRPAGTVTPIRPAANTGRSVMIRGGCRFRAASPGSSGVTERGRRTHRLCRASERDRARADPRLLRQGVRLGLHRLRAGLFSNHER